MYTKGIVSNYNYLRTAITAGRPELIRWLFAGKVALEDVPGFAERVVVPAPGAKTPTKGSARAKVTMTVFMERSRSVR